MSGSTFINTDIVNGTQTGTRWQFLRCLPLSHLPVPGNLYEDWLLPRADFTGVNGLGHFCEINEVEHQQAFQ